MKEVTEISYPTDRVTEKFLIPLRRLASVCLVFHRGMKFHLPRASWRWKFLIYLNGSKNKYSAEVVPLDNTQKQFPLDMPGVPKKKVYET